MYGTLGKLFVLFRLMQTLRAVKQGERIVVVSNYTQTLDLIEGMCRYACVVVCCGVLCCVVLCCVVVWCVVVCCVVVCCGVLWCVVVCCGVLWCVVVCCGVLCCLQCLFIKFSNEMNE